MTSWKQQQAEMAARIGFLLGPLLRLATHPEQFDGDERTRIVARFHADNDGFHDEIHRFAASQPGHWFIEQSNRAVALLLDLRRRVERSDALTVEYMQSVQSGMLAAICEIPTPLDSTIHAARSPFSTYCLLRDVCATARGRVVWADRYFDSTIFHRFLRAIPDDVPATLVTRPRSACRGAKDERRFDEFMDVSRLFAQERGPDLYRLITNVAIHDRILQAGDAILLLGGSAKEIGHAAAFAVSRLDDTLENRDRVVACVDGGDEAFGPQNPTHP